MPEHGLVLALGDFIASVEPDADVRGDARRRVMDTLGNALAARDEDVALAARRLASQWAGRGEASAIGLPGSLPAPSAALVNGTLAHALDFDDTHLPSVLHPSASVVPAALAVAEAVDADGRGFLDAVAVGGEVCVRIGMASYDAAARNHILFDKGFHATSICGTMGAAAAAARLLSLDGAEAAHAVAIAASMGAGLIEANRTGGTVKRIHCGWAAHAGIVAAQFAAAGITGPPTVLEGRFGFFNAYSDGRFSTEAVTGSLADHWEVVRTFFKPYPTNHFTHAGIDAALRLREHGLDPDTIEAIELGVAEPTLRTIAEPPDRKAAPASAYAAKFSGPFTVAAALVGGGGLGVAATDFTAATIADPSRLRLAGLVTCVADPIAGEVFPNQFPGVLRVTLRDGSTREARVEHNRGGPENPLREDELAAKFRANAGVALEPDSVARLEGEIAALDAAPSIRGLADALTDA